jgi:hypothetical protein
MAGMEKVDLSVDAEIDEHGVLRFGCRTTRKKASAKDWISSFSRSEPLDYDGLKAEVEETLEGNGEAS